MTELNTLLYITLLRLAKERGEVIFSEETEDKLHIKINLHTPMEFTGFESTQGGKKLSAVLENSLWLTVIAKDTGMSEIEINNYEQHIAIFTLKGVIESIHIKTKPGVWIIQSIEYYEEKDHAKLHLRTLSMTLDSISRL